MVRLMRAPSRMSSAPRRVAPRPKQVDSFYRSPEWKALVARRIGDPDWREAKGRAQQGERLILDHVVEIKDGGAKLDPANTQWLTFSEHQAKTAAEKRRRAGLAPGDGGRSPKGDRG